LNLLGLAAALIWREGGFEKQKLPLTLFLIQLVFNGLWSWVFFGAHQIGWALAEILGLWVLIVLTLVSFWQTLPLAGALLVPYLLWVSFASFLNFTLWKLNP